MWDRTRYDFCQQQSKQEDRKIFEFILNDLMLAHEEFVQMTEDLFANWNDDGEMLAQLVLQYFVKPIGFDFNKFIDIEKEQFAITEVGKDGKVAAGQEVTFNINGVFYHRVSDDNGIVSLGIKLRPGTYIVTAEYEGCWVSNNITVLPTLITKDLDMK